MAFRDYAFFKHKKQNLCYFIIDKKLLTISIIEIQDIIIIRVTNFNFLGKMLDENLNWSTYTGKISVAISPGDGILYKLKNFSLLMFLRLCITAWLCIIIIWYLGMGNLQ